MIKEHIELSFGKNLILILISFNSIYFRINSFLITDRYIMLLILWHIYNRKNIYFKYKKYFSVMKITAGFKLLRLTLCLQLALCTIHSRFIEIDRHYRLFRTMFAIWGSLFVQYISLYLQYIWHCKLPRCWFALFHFTEKPLH